MKKADTGKVKVVRDDALIVAVDIGMEMNRGYYGGPRNSDSVLSYTWEQKRGGPSGEFEEEAHTII